MKQFEIIVCTNGTLQIVSRHTLYAKDVDEARKTGIAKYQKLGVFVGAQRVQYV